MSVQINVQASQSALAQSIAQGVAAFNSRYAGQNQLNLQINARAFSQPLGRITSDLADFESALKASNARVLAFGASTAVLGGVVRSFKEIANVTIEVEKSLTDINRVLNLSTNNLQKFSSELFSISKQTASSFDDATKAALEFSRQGLNTEETLKRTADALTLVRLTGISSTKAVEDLTATINGFAKAGLTTSQVVNKLAAVEQDFAVSAADLTEALSRTGQAAQEAGVDFDELNALVTTAQQNTARGGAVIGNALKTIFTRLQRTETLDQLEKFNIIVRDIQGNILPAVQILQNFANKYNDLADAQRAQLSEQVAGVYQVNILKGIITDLTGVQSTYTKALERGTEASNEADIANQKLNKTLSALASQTGVGLQQLANNIGKVTFAPLFEAIVSPINDAVKYINDTLEGEGPGSIFANGLLKGIRNVIAGPGLAVTFAVIAKVAKNTFEDATKALPAILGLTTEAQKRANIEKSIISILQTQSNLSLALQGQQGNISTQAATVLNYARLQTAQYQQQLQIAQQLAPLLAAQNVTVGARGIQVGPRIKAGGHIPAFAEMSERMGAAMGGYRSGKVVKAPKSVGANTYMNSAEEVKYVAGFAQPFINPPANSKAGRKHRQNAINRTGVDPYMAGGFIPNFARSKKTDYVLGTGFKGDLTSLPLNEKEEKEVGSVANLRTLIGSNFITDKIGGRKGIYYKIKEVRGRTNAQMRQQAEKIAMSGSMADIKKFIPTGQLSSFDFDLWFKNRSLPNINDNTQVERLTKNTGKGTVAFADQKRGLVTLMTGEIFEQRVSELENLTRSEISNNRFDFLPSDVSKFLGGEAKAGAFSLGNLVAKAIGVTPPGNFKNKERETIPLDLPIQLFVPEGHQELNKSFSNGFIPNFALPLSTARIPWFKKYSSKYKNTAGDTDLFKMGDFPTYGRGLDHEYAKSGNSSMLSYLHEDFVKSAINIALGSKKIIRPAEVGFKDKPISEISNENDFDLLYRIADGSYSMLELKQDFRNISGSVTGFMTRKLENLKKENPVLAKKVSSMIAVSNMPKFIDPTGKNPAGQFSEFETAIAAIVKDKYSNVDPTISAKLTKVTDGLLRRYEAKKNTNSAGFIPNFASMLSASIKGKGNISAIKTGKNNYEIEGFEVGKKFRGQGLGSQLYRKLIEKIGPGNYITGTLLPQEQALADYASGKPVPAKAIFPQLSRAKMAKSSKLLVNRKEMAISDFEKGIASHKYNAAKLEMALIELITSHASGFIPNFGLMKGYAFNDGRIYDDIYHSDAWDSIVGPRTGAIKYANYNGKLVYQAKSISEKLKQAFISKGIPASAFSPVEDVDAALRSKNTQEINDKLNQIGAVQLSGDIKAIYERGLYTKLLKDNQSFTIPGGISPKELSIFGGIDNWIKYYEKHYKALKWQSFAGGFIPNFTELINTEIDAILQPISKSRTIASKKLFGKPLDNDAIRYLNATSVEKLNQYLRAYGYLDGALGVDFPDKPDKKFLFTKNKGFIPNFAYKQAVMGLEEGMSGNKAIFDTKPFPHIRNSSQPSFASAISDHGGLKNALNDSIKNQEAAGLMNGGYIPNFAATVNPNLAFPGYGYKSLNTQEKQTFVKLNQELKKLATDTSLTATQMTALKASIMSQADSLKKSTGLTEIVTETNKALIEATKRAANGQIAANNANNNRTSIFKKMYGPAATTQNQYITSASNTSSGIRGVLGGASNLTNKLSSNVGFQIAVPMIAGQIESAIAGNRDRSEMSFGRRFASTGASAALTGASTGALIGSIIPGFGTAIGAAVGAVAGLTGAFLNAKDTVNDFSNVIQKANQKDREGQEAVQGYVNAVKQLEQGGMSPKEQAKIEKEREKFFLKIPAQIRSTLTGTENAMDVESKILDKMETENINRTKARSLQELGGSDLTKENFNSIRQNLAELSLVDQRFANVARAIYTSKTGEERAAFLAKGGGLEEQLSKSELFKSLNKEEQVKIVTGFREAFGNSIQGTIRSSSLGTSVEAAKASKDMGKVGNSKLPLVKKSATDIFLEIDKFLSDTSNQLRQTLAADQFKDKFTELKTTFENSLVEGFIAPAKAISADTAMKKTMLQNTFNREIKTANDEFSQKFANEIRNTPVVGASPKVMSDLQNLLQKPGGATVQDFEAFLSKLPLMQIPLETIQKMNKMIQDQKNLEQEKKDALTREQKIVDENARQLLIRQELAIFEANQASKISAKQSETQRGLTTRQTTFDIQQAQSESYLGYQPNFYNMGMQQESELRIRYREASSKKSLDLMKESQLNAAKTNILDSERLKIMTQIEAAQKAGKDDEVKRLQNIPLFKEINLDNLESLQKTIKAQDTYLETLKENDKEYASAKNALENLKNIQNDINNNVTKETELLKIRNEEDRKRVRDAKSFSVGLSAGFNDINKERETFANDFGQKIPGLFRDGLVGAMDAALNKADDLESALMGVAASFLREIQGMMLRNIANNLVGSIGSAFSFGQPATTSQRGGIIRAQSGMYISGGRTGDKNPALLEDGEYVLNRNAVKALGGPRAIDQLNFNAFPRFATGGDPGTMSASVSMSEPFERLSMYGREQSPEYQSYLERLREEEAAREKKRAERKALLNQFIGTLISTGISMGLSSAVGAAKEASMAKANLKGATGSLPNGTTTQVTSFADAKNLINSGGSVTLANGSVLNKSDFGSFGISRSSFNEISANRFASSGITVKPGGLFGKTNYNLRGTSFGVNKINENFTNPATAFGRSQSIYEFAPFGKRQKGGVIGFNQGGFLPYGSRLTDSIPAYLTGGEYVVNSRAVRKYGVGGLNRINAGIARFQDGGMVGDNISPSSNSSNTSNSNISINITVNATNGKVGDQESDTKGDGTEGNSKELSNKIKAVVLDVITTEQRSGGLLDSTKKK